jgi:hypothetical protein
MNFRYSAECNLGTKPELRFVAVGDEQRAVTDLRGYFARLIPNPSKAEGEPKLIDLGGFWNDAASCWLRVHECM